MLQEFRLVFLGFGIFLFYFYCVYVSARTFKQLLGTMFNWGFTSECSYFQGLGGSLLDSPGNSIITTAAVTTTLAKLVLLLAAMVSARFLFRKKKNI